MSTQSLLLYLLGAVYFVGGIVAAYGLVINWHKKQEYLDNGVYEKRRVALQWRSRFLTCVSLAAVLRAISLIVSGTESQKLTFKPPKKAPHFLLQELATASSCLFFTSFCLIVWFFARVVYRSNEKVFKLVTPFFFGVNFGLYLTEILLLLVTVFLQHDYGNKWKVSYTVGHPLECVCDLFLVVCFVFLPLKIKSILKEESVKIDPTLVGAETVAAKMRGSGSVGFYPREKREYSYSGLMAIPMKFQYYDVEEREREADIQRALTKPHAVYSATMRKLTLLSSVCALLFLFRAVYGLLFQCSKSVRHHSMAEVTYFAISELPPFFSALAFMLYSSHSTTAKATAKTSIAGAKHKSYQDADEEIRQPKRSYKSSITH